MKQLGPRLYAIYSMDDLVTLNTQHIKYNNMLLIIPGMLDTDVVDSEYAQIADTAIEITKNTDWTVVLVHNQSNGFLLDLGRSIFGKLFGGFCKLLCQEPPEQAGKILGAILNIRPTTCDTVIMCHSQGGIIATNAIDCCNNIYMRASVKVRFFGAANWFLPQMRARNTTGFTSRYDLVSYLFGRGFIDTYKLHKATGHAVTNYRPSMELVLQNIFGSMSDIQLETELENV